MSRKNDVIGFYGGAALCGIAVSVCRNYFFASGVFLQKNNLLITAPRSRMIIQKYIQSMIRQIAARLP